EEAVIPAATSDSGVVSPGIASKEWRIEAETFGPDYNIPSDSTVVDLQVGSYPMTGSDRVVGKRFKAITGGTTENFKSVSQEDVDGIKQKLTDRLVKQGKDKLKSLVRDGYIILGGTEEFEEKKVTSVPDI